MKTWFVENWLRLIIAILLAVLLFSFYYKNTNVPALEIYKLNSDCGKIATNFAKENSGDFSVWNVLQNSFNIQKGGCFAEFGVIGSGDTSAKYIYDLTHNKEIAWLPDAMYDGDEQVYEAYLSRYEATMAEVFVK